MRGLCSIALCLALAGCAGGGANAGQTSSPNGGPSANDPDARSFTGRIISLRFTTSTMLISKPEKAPDGARGIGVPNEVLVRYDANTHFFLDSQPATLDQIDKYMLVTIHGHMRNGQLFAETASFSSALPPGIKPSTVEPGPAPITTRPAR
jgi:hypothetical protein